MDKVFTTTKRGEQTMKTQMTTQLMIESIQRQIELLNDSADLTHNQKRGALELMSLELDEVLIVARK